MYHFDNYKHIYCGIIVFKFKFEEKWFPASNLQIYIVCNSNYFVDLCTFRRAISLFVSMESISNPRNYHLDREASACLALKLKRL